MKASYTTINAASIALIIGVWTVSTLPLARADSTGPQNPTTITTQGDVPWTNPELAGASDDTHAVLTTVLPSVGGELRASGFGFAVPFGATVTGIEITVERHQDLPVAAIRGGGSSAAVNIEPPGSAPEILGYRFDDTGWLTVDAVGVLGGETDRWGRT